MTALIARQFVDISKPDTPNGVNVANFGLGTGNLWDCVQTLGVGVGAVAAGTTALTQANAGLILVDASAGNVVLNLPAASAAVGALFQFKRVDAVPANTVTINRAGADLIDGLSAMFLLSQYDFEQIRSDGVSAWSRIGIVARLDGAQMANLWINSDFGINQRGLTNVADGAYALDNTYLLTESGNLTVGQLTQPTDGIPYAMRLTQPDASAKRMGFAQAIEARNCLAYRGSSLVFAPKLRLSVGATLRVALLAHTGTADTITRDVVNNWASGTYTPGNFFISSTLSVIACGGLVVGANTWTDVPVSSLSANGVVAPSGMTNLILMAWTEGAAAQNVTLDASLIRVGSGWRVPIWTPPDAEAELRRCQRWRETVRLRSLSYFQTVTGNALDKVEATGFWKASKRIPPALTPTNNGTGTLTNILNTVDSFVYSRTGAMDPSSMLDVTVLGDNSL